MGLGKGAAGITTPEEVMETTEEDAPELFADEPTMDASEGTRTMVEGEEKPSDHPPRTLFRRPEKGRILNISTQGNSSVIACDIPVLFRVVDYQGTIPYIQAQERN